MTTDITVADTLMAHSKPQILTPNNSSISIFVFNYLNLIHYQGKNNNITINSNNNNKNNNNNMLITYAPSHSKLTKWCLHMQ